MHRLARFALLAVVVAACAYGVTSYYTGRRSEDQWTWLRREFHLNTAQLTRIHALHAAFQPVCADHCNRVAAAQQRLTALEQAGGKSSPEYAATAVEWDAIKRECNAATLRHLQAVAQVMDPDQARRYLAMMVPRIARSDHQGPRGVR